MRIALIVAVGVPTPDTAESVRFLGATVDVSAAVVVDDPVTDSTESARTRSRLAVVVLVPAAAAAPLTSRLSTTAAVASPDANPLAERTTLRVAVVVDVAAAVVDPRSPPGSGVPTVIYGNPVGSVP